MATLNASWTSLVRLHCAVNAAVAPAALDGQLAASTLNALLENLTAKVDDVRPETLDNVNVTVRIAEGLSFDTPFHNQPSCCAGQLPFIAFYRVQAPGTTDQAATRAVKTYLLCAVLTGGPLLVRPGLQRGSSAPRPVPCCMARLPDGRRLNAAVPVPPGGRPAAGRSRGGGGARAPLGCNGAASHKAGGCYSRGGSQPGGRGDGRRGGALALRPDRVLLRLVSRWHCACCASACTVYILPSGTALPAGHFGTHHHKLLHLCAQARLQQLFGRFAADPEAAVRTALRLLRSGGAMRPAARLAAARRLLPWALRVVAVDLYDQVGVRQPSDLLY